ncbi:MAG: bifunctional 5,10-methylenetetrahydrofolate dehydrogenase/5,10-methenyltetrahydrofolate cyclohydrolase [Candidatus Saccharimonadales bacterium]
MLLKSSELADYIKAQQVQAVRSLQHTGIKPKLAIVQAGTMVVSDTYVRLKQAYGQDIGVEVERYDTDTSNLVDTIQRLNGTDSIHGIIVQLPLPESIDTGEVLNRIDSVKDVDGLGAESAFDPATPTAILWLLSEGNVELDSKTIGVIGHGRLVGAPLVRILKASGHEPLIADKETGDVAELMRECDVVITATGRPGLITPDMVHSGQVIIDAGTSSEDGSLVGDVDSSLYERSDLKISPVPGGVGPLTVAALFANVIEAFKRQGRG